MYYLTNSVTKISKARQGVKAALRSRAQERLEFQLKVF